MRYFSLHNMENLPDHIIHEIQSLSREMEEILFPLINNRDSNISIAALNFVHASMIKQWITETPDSVMDAAFLSADALIKNVHDLCQRTGTMFNLEKKQMFANENEKKQFDELLGKILPHIERYPTTISLNVALYHLACAIYALPKKEYRIKYAENYLATVNNIIKSFEKEEKNGLD